MNNSKQNANKHLNFSLRYLIRETEEYMPSSWCSAGANKVTVQAKPVLQYTLDGVEWRDVLTITERVKK